MMPWFVVGIVLDGQTVVPSSRENNVQSWRFRDGFLNEIRIVHLYLIDKEQ